MESDTQNWNILTRTRDWYGRFERPISSLSLIGGFIFDAITLRRVDALWDNIWVIGHLLIVGACIILINRENIKMSDDNATRREMVRTHAEDPATFHFWLVNVMQFFFGGILSTYLVFYFRSGALSVNWPFLLILGLAFWANESLKKQYVRLSFQIILFYLSLFAFSIYLIPVLTHHIGTWIFILSGVISLIAINLFLRVLSYFTDRKLQGERVIVFSSIIAIFFVVNMMYFSNLIPPIPLSLKDSGVYHAVSSDGQGNYTVTTEPTTWRNFFTRYDNFHILLGQPVYVYSAIFSPPLLNITIVHAYQAYDTTTKKWMDKGSIPLSVIGGREEGFRTFSVKNDLFPGHWRVNVKTQSGQTIGTIYFNVIMSSAGNLQTEVK